MSTETTPSAPAKYETRVTQLTIAPPGQPLFSELAITVTLEDEAAGEFIVIQQHDDDCGKIAIGPDEWPALKAAVERLLKGVRK